MKDVRERRKGDQMRKVVQEEKIYQKNKLIQKKEDFVIERIYSTKEKEDD